MYGVVVGGADTPAPSWADPPSQEIADQVSERSRLHRSDKREAGVHKVLPAAFSFSCTILCLLLLPLVLPQTTCQGRGQTSGTGDLGSSPGSV